jgi:hypothetical protein
MNVCFIGRLPPLTSIMRTIHLTSMPLRRSVTHPLTSAVRWRA